MTRVVGIIPARLASSRFPGKVLENIAGAAMIERVWSAAAGSGFDELWFCTPDDALVSFANARGWPTRKTRAYNRALDQVAEAATAIVGSENDIVVNVQSDEPLVTAGELRAFVVDADRETGVRIVLMARPIDDAERHDPNAVKLVVANNRMLYSTRAPIGTGLRIAGMFALTPAALREFTAMPESPLERLEACDVNRLLDAGVPVGVHVCQRAVPSVDVPADIARVETYLKEQHVNN